MANGNSPNQERVLLVEGQNDMHVVRHLWFRHYNSDPNFRVSVKDGIDNLLPSIRGEILSEERTTVGIVLDADDYPVNRWEAVADKLKEAGIAPPSNLSPSGTIIESDPRVGVCRVGVWLMPDNQHPGELEDFIAGMVSPGDPVWPLSEEYINNIPENHRKFAAGKITRAKVHAWLATRADPRPMGLAIRAGDLDVKAQIAAGFIDWLRKLFG